MASISSMKMMQGACFFAAVNRSRTRRAPTPTNTCIKHNMRIVTCMQQALWDLADLEWHLCISSLHTVTSCTQHTLHAKQNVSKAFNFNMIATHMHSSHLVCCSLTLNFIKKLYINDAEPPSCCRAHCSTHACATAHLLKLRPRCIEERYSSFTCSSGAM